MAQTHPYVNAVACPAGRDRAGRVRYVHWTFQQLDRESDTLARGLASFGVSRGVRAVLMVKPGLEFFALTFALFKAGAVPVLIDPGMGIKNLGQCLAEAEPAAFLGIPAAQLARRIFGWAKDSLRISITVQPVGEEYRRVRSADLPPAGDPRREGPQSRFYGRLEHLSMLSLYQFGASENPFPIAPTLASETAAILFTSGSTGPPKGAVYTQGIFDAQVRILRDLYRIEPGEIDLCTFPLFALFAPALGMTSIVPEMDFTRPAKADPVKIIQAIESFGATNMFGSPALIRRVGAYGSERGIRLPSLRRVISAGAPVPARVLETFSRMLRPEVPILTPYGATDSLPVASIASQEILAETRHATDKGLGVCVGKPVPEMTVEVIRIDDEPIAAWSDDLRVPQGEIGEIVVYGPVVTESYFHRPAMTALAKIRDEADGRILHRMGDLGYIDAAGRIWFCGRKSQRVVNGSETWFTIPCEAVFNTHPLVNRTALIGLGPKGKQTPALCVELKTKARSRGDRDRLRRELRAIAESFPHTKAIQTFLFHPSFPVDIRHNAKIFREKLAVWAAKGAGP